MPKKVLTGTEAQSLLDFARERRLAELRAICAVCRLPDAVRAEIKAAPSKKITRRDVVAWLTARHHITLTDGDLQSHTAGHHEN